MIDSVARLSKTPQERAFPADIAGVRQHCAQCLTEVIASGYDTPTGETLCGPCYSALWGPQATEELRLLVDRHMGRPNGDRLVAPVQP